MHTRYLQRTILAASCLLFTLLSPLGKATLYSVSLDTSNLVGNAARPFSLEFTLLDGEGTTDNINNTIQLIDFNFGEGSFRLDDTINAITVPFTRSGVPLPRLSFRVDTTNNPSPGSSGSDSFIFRILNGVNDPIPTIDPNESSFLTIALYPAPGAVSTYGTPNGAPITIGAPTVQLLSPTVLPEPPTSLLLAIGLGGLLATWRSLRFGGSLKTLHGWLSA